MASWAREADAPQSRPTASSEWAAASGGQTSRSGPASGGHRTRSGPVLRPVQEDSEEETPDG
eukprot:688364-Lingulodinium_polyedra.AAC.1